MWALLQENLGHPGNQIAVKRRMHLLSVTRTLQAEIHEVVGTISREFRSFWQAVCLMMKDAPVESDAHATGRLPRTKFTARNSPILSLTCERAVRLMKLHLGEASS